MMKYQSLEEELIELILTGKEVSLNGQFISERRISEIFNISRTTVRKAILRLCKQGYLTRVHGKGTFIKQCNYYQELDSITRCAQNYSSMGLNPSITVLCQEVVPATTLIASFLKVAVNDPVLKLEKLYQVNEDFINETLSYLPVSRFPDLEYADFSVLPIMEIFRIKYGAHPKRTENFFEAILPPPKVAQSLKITTDTPIILFESVTSGIANGRILPLEYFKTYYKTDRFRFSFIQEHDSVSEN